VDDPKNYFPTRQQIREIFNLNIQPVQSFVPIRFNGNSYRLYARIDDIDEYDTMKNWLDTCLIGFYLTIQDIWMGYTDNLEFTRIFR